MSRALRHPPSRRPLVCRFPRSLGLAVILAAGCTTPTPESETPTGDPASPTVSAASAQVHTISQATVSVELDTPGDVAAACIARDEPAEVHLLEARAEPSVDLRFAGLLASTDYDCSVVPLQGDAPPVQVSFRTFEPPPDISLASADATSSHEAEMTGTYTVMNIKPECQSDNGRNYIAVLDPDGNNRWRYDLPYGMNIGVEVTLDGPNRFLWGGGKHSVGAPEVVDVVDGPQWKLSFPRSAETEFHHDAKRLPDGTVLSVEQHDDPGWLSTQLRVSTDSGETLWLWDMQSAVDAGELPPGDHDTYDPHHVNWADIVDAGDGPVAYLSLCFSEQIMAVDVASGDVLWRFGPYADWDIVDASGQPLDEDEFPQCQHGLQIDGTHMLVYDNGFKRGYTRVVEYELDHQNMVATKVWEWVDDGFWNLYHGGNDWLTPDHSRVLVTESANNCTAGERHPQIVEVDRSRDDLVVHRLVLREVSDWIYRAHRVDGCDLFANARYCPDLAERFEELRPRLGL